MCGCVKHEFPQDLGRAISKLSAFVRWITSKEIHVASIPQWRQEIVEIVVENHTTDNVICPRLT